MSTRRPSLMVLLPLIAFLLLVGFFAKGLFLDPRAVPSPLIGRAAPAFVLPVACDTTHQFKLQDMAGKVWLLNMWSTWCPSCSAEHEQLMTIAQQSAVPLVGMAYKELRGDSSLDQAKVTALPSAEAEKLACGRIGEWLDRRGNPYKTVVLDMDGRVGIDYGVYGVPETYLIDAKGIIRHKHTGLVTEAVWKETLEPMLKELAR